MIARYTALIAGLAGLALAINYANSGYNVRVGEPDLVVTELPFKMARWTGDEQPILDDTVRVLNAHSFINRVYRDDLGREITMHAAVWAKPDLGEIAPHHPEVCYTAAGWQIMSRRIVYANDMRERPVELISFQKEEIRSSQLTSTRSVILNSQTVAILGGRYYDFGAEMYALYC